MVVGSHPLSPWWRASMVLVLLLCAPVAWADAAALRARYAELRETLRASSFGRPLVIDSAQTSSLLEGRVHALLPQPYPVVREVLREPARWCDILILPFNTKYCRIQSDGAATQLQLRIGRKATQPVEQAYRLMFDFTPVAATAEGMETRLLADEGPFGTRNYRIVVEAIPVEGDRTFLRLDYAYGYGMLGRAALGAYLATTGASKVGFTEVGRDEQGRPQYIGGLRGLIERNSMRYYLAILATVEAPQPGQLQRRLEAWFDASEQYALQLHEMDKATYVALKQQEAVRMRTPLP